MNEKKWPGIGSQGVGLPGVGWPGLGIIALALLASVTGIANRFAYDDLPIVLLNDRIHHLGSAWRLFGQPYWSKEYGGGLYRPLTTALFSVEWAVGGGSPLPFHVLNIVLYVLIALAVYAVARRVLPTSAAWLAAALFAVHPVHVEAVGNVVGQSELLAALFVVGAVAVYLSRRMADPAAELSGRTIATVTGLYALGMLSKEHAITLPGLLLVAEATVIADARPWRERVRAVRLTGLVLAATGLAFLWVRGQVIGDVVGDTPAMELQTLHWSERAWTMLGVVPDWVRLFVWPARLVAAYSPPQTMVWRTFDQELVPGLVVLLALVALAVAARRRLPVAAFGIGWTAVAMLPISNLIVRSGVLLAERTLFLPSVGVALTAGAVAMVAAARLAGAPKLARQGGMAGVVLLLGAGAWRSATRQLVWRDDAALFGSGVRDAPLSYEAHYLWGRELEGEGQPDSAKHELWLALRLSDNDPRVPYALGLEYFNAGNCHVAEPLFVKTLELYPRNLNARLQLSDCYVREQNYVALRGVARGGMAWWIRPGLFRHVELVADSAVRSGGRYRPGPQDLKPTKQ